MSVYDIINIVLAVLTVIVGFLAAHFKGNSKLYSRVASLISRWSRQTYTDANSGGLKMQYVVGKLYGLLPVWTKPFIPKSVIQTIAQTVFNQVAAYATKQLDKATTTTATPVTAAAK